MVALSWFIAHRFEPNLYFYCREMTTRLLFISFMANWQDYFYFTASVVNMTILFFAAFRLSYYVYLPKSAYILNFEENPFLFKIALYFVELSG